ncbi:MAG TPA: hypothetical protein VFX17_00360 [Patescibacteria group bacterium]|nr:hypothetical protein [Patescibacteria group bacterium]
MDFLNPKIRTQPQVSMSNANAANPNQSSSVSMPATQTNVFTKIINYSLIALVFLIPLFFLPLTSEVREFNKQNLLILGVLIMLAAWVIRVLSTRRVSWVKTSLDYVILAYAAIYVLASYLSIDRPSSFLGYVGRFSGSCISVIALVLLYFLVVNNVRGQKITQRIMDALIAASGLATIYGLLQTLKWYVLPAFTHSQSFNSIGSMVALSIFGAMSITLYQWQLLASPKSSVLKKSVLGVLMVLSLILMFLINAFIGWLVLAIGMVVFTALGMMIVGTEEGSDQQSWFWRPMVVLVIAILFVAFQILPASINPRNLVSNNLNLPVEIQLSNSATFNLVKNSVSSGAKTAIFGSGPGTTGIAFGQIKPADLNKTVVWSLNFDRASSEIANITIETGILGLVAFEAASILFLIYALYFLLKRAYHVGKMYAFGFFTIWSVLYLAHFFYFFNTTFYFLYWLAIAAFMAVAHWNFANQQDPDMNMNTSPRTALSWMFASLLMLALILVGAFFEASVYVAEASYTSGVKNLSQSNPDFNQAQSQFNRAVSLNPYRDIYHLASAQNQIFLASIEAAKDKPDVNQAITWIQGAIADGNAATQISPNNAGNWSALAQIYNAISPLGVEGTALQASTAWQEAIKHDSQNPALEVQLANAYYDASTTIDPKILGTGTDSDGDGLTDQAEATFKSDPHNSDTNGNGTPDGAEVLAGFNPAGVGTLDNSILNQYQRVDNSLLKQAADAANQSINLKNDFPDPYIVLARVYEKENQLTDAKKVLDDAAIKFNRNPDILFEQGRITFNSGDSATAEKIFNDVLTLEPNDADALFSLGLIYEPKDPAKALDYYQQVRQITGPNVDLDKKINDLKASVSNSAK